MTATITKLRPLCPKCGWAQGGPDSWDGVACKCRITAPAIERVDEERIQGAEYIAYASRNLGKDRL